MRTVIKFVLVGTIILITANSLLEYLQSFVFGGHRDFELARIFFLYTIILFQWVFILALCIFYFVRAKLKNLNFVLAWILGSLISFAFYSFYWLGANSGDMATLRLAIINSVTFGFIMETLYNKIVLK